MTTDFVAFGRAQIDRKDFYWVSWKKQEQWIEWVTQGSVRPPRSDEPLLLDDDSHPVFSRIFPQNNSLDSHLSLVLVLDRQWRQVSLRSIEYKLTGRISAGSKGRNRKGGSSEWQGIHFDHFFSTTTSLSISLGIIQQEPIFDSD